MIDTVDKKFLILSFGRSASIMLAHRVSAHLKVDLKFVHSHSGLALYPVQHTHLFHSIEELNPFQRIFNLRRDPIQTVLSFIFVERFGVYQVVANENNDIFYQHSNRQASELTLKPFEYKDWQAIDTICTYYNKWHNFYSALLDNNDYVVFYEDILEKVENRSINYRPVYNNKEEFLLNYTEVLDYIKIKHNTDMMNSQRTFAQHQNQTDIYDFLSTPVR